MEKVGQIILSIKYVQLTSYCGNLGKLARFLPRRVYRQRQVLHKQVVMLIGVALHL